MPKNRSAIAVVTIALLLAALPLVLVAVSGRSTTDPSTAALKSDNERTTSGVGGGAKAEEEVVDPAAADAEPDDRLRLSVRTAVEDRTDAASALLVDLADGNLAVDRPFEFGRPASLPLLTRPHMLIVNAAGHETLVARLEPAEGGGASLSSPDPLRDETEFGRIVPHLHRFRPEGTRVPKSPPYRANLESLHVEPGGVLKVELVPMAELRVFVQTALGHRWQIGCVDTRYETFPETEQSHLSGWPIFIERRDASPESHLEWPIYVPVARRVVVSIPRTFFTVTRRQTVFVDGPAPSTSCSTRR
jgi:hypothetical protein